MATSGTNKNTDIIGLTFYTDNNGNIQYKKSRRLLRDKYFFLFDDKVKFYNKDDFNLSKSVFDAFDQALMTEYGYGLSLDKQSVHG